MTFIRVIQHEARSLKWWWEQASAGLLDLDPPYQRKSDLWSKYKKAHLIDSIINGFDIPKFYVADFTVARSDLNKVNRPYAVVDGKQRFEAIFAFLRGDLMLNGSAIVEECPGRIIRGMDFGMLRRTFPDIAERVMAFEPVVMSIVTDDEAKVAEMFVRLNSGEAATSAERRNARPGPIPPMVRELVAHPFFVSRVSFSKKRMADYNLALKLLMIEYLGEFSDTKAGNLDRFVLDALTDTETDPEVGTREKGRRLAKYVEAKNRVIDTLEVMAELFSPKDKLLSSAGNVPIYYWVLRSYPSLGQRFHTFLRDFNERVLSAMRDARNGMDADPVLLSYYTQGRSTNDQRSLEGRYEIIHREMRRRRLITGRAAV